MSARTTYQRLRATPGFGRDTLVIVAMITLGTLVGGYILANQRFSPPWADPYTAAAEFDEAPGISPGNGQEVRMAGVPVGDIVKADVTEDGKARLTFTVSDKGSKLYENATIVLRPKSPLNEMYLEIAPGGPPAKPLAEGSVLPTSQTQDPEQVDEVLQHLDEQSRTAIGALLAEADLGLANAGAALPPGLRAADATLDGLQPVVEQLRMRRENIRKLVTSLSDIATVAGKDDERLAALVRDARTTLKVLEERGADLDASLASLPGVTDELRRSTAAVEVLADELDPALEGLRAGSKDLPRALNDLRGTVGRLDSTLDVAGPLAREAVPVVRDLRPLIAGLRPSLTEVLRLSPRFDVATEQLVAYLPSLKDFVYNTNSITSLEDANGPILRGLFQTGPESLPVSLPSVPTVPPIGGAGR